MFLNGLSYPLKKIGKSFQSGDTYYSILGLKKYEINRHGSFPP